MNGEIPVIGFEPTAGLAIDLDQLVTSRLLVQANSGGGKSWAGRYLLENTVERIPQFVFDIEGEYTSLRSLYSYVLVGGDSGDLPAVVEHAAALCKRLVAAEVSAIIDLSELSPADRHAYVRRFIDALMNLPRELWRPRLVVIDEIHVFAPERGYGESEALPAVVALATRGRKRGYALAGFTQRLAKLHNDVAAELANVLIGRTWLTADVRRAADVLGLDKTQRQELKNLVPGTFYAFGPAISRDVVLVRTGDVRTHHPEPGAIAAPAPAPPDELRVLLDELRAIAPAPSAADVEDLESARAAIARLERELQEREPVVERVEVPVISDELRDRFLEVVAQMTAALTEVGAALRLTSPVVEADSPAPNDERPTTNAQPSGVDDGMPLIPVERNRQISLPTVQARIRAAASGMEDGSAGYMDTILRKTWLLALTPAQIAEAQGTPSARTVARIKRAGAALVKHKLVVEDRDGKLQANRDEFARLWNLAHLP